MCIAPPDYVRCPTCGTRVTLALLWRLRAGGVHPAELRLPLTLNLVARVQGEPDHEQRLLLTHLPLMLGLRDHAGTITFDLPTMFWLRERSTPLEPAAGNPLVTTADNPRYDGRLDMRKLLESVFRRTLLGSSKSYRSFAKRLCGDFPTRRRLSWAPARTARGFDKRLRSAVATPDPRGTDLLRFADLSFECVVASSPVVRGNAVVANQRLTRAGALSAPVVKNVSIATHNGDSATSWTLNAVPPDGDEPYPGLGSDGLAIPGQLVAPGDVLVGMCEPVPVVDLSPEDRLLYAIFGDKPGVRGFQDASLRLDGSCPGRVVAQRIVTGARSDTFNVAEVAGRSFGKPDELDWSETQRITVSLVVDLPMAAGDTLVRQDGTSAVVCDITGGRTLDAMAGTTEEPDLVVAPGHPWAPSGGMSMVRVRLRHSELVGAAPLSGRRVPTHTTFCNPGTARTSTATPRSCCRPTSTGSSPAGCGGSPPNYSAQGATS